MMKTTKSILKKVTATLLAASIVTTAGIGSITANASGYDLRTWGVSYIAAGSQSNHLIDTITFPNHGTNTGHNFSCQGVTNVAKVEFKGVNVTVSIGSQTQPIPFSSPSGTGFSIVKKVANSTEVYSFTLTPYNTGKSSSAYGQIIQTY